MNSGKLTEAAGLGRRLAALLYEALLVLALVLVAAFAFQGAASDRLDGWARHIFQIYLVLVIGLYFVCSWVRGGQTLPMKTWRLRLVCADGTSLTTGRAWVRYALSWISLATAGAGFAWALVDREGQFLHDRLAGTRMVKI